jgi:hypothetical protein
MSYAQPFLRLVVIGRLYDVEDFTFSLAMISDFPGSAEDPPETVPTAVIEAVRGYFGSSGVAASSAKVTAVKLNKIGTDGRYTEDTTVLQDVVPPIAGTGSINPAPQLATAVTLVTALTRGRASKGRYYLPLPGFSPAADGRLSAPNAENIASSSWAFIQALNAGVPGFDVGVTSNIGAGAQHPVTSVRVGRVLDTMRSRREGFDEGYMPWPRPV